MIELWIKLAYSALLAVILPTYVRWWGWKNFLWFSDIALIATGIALWLHSSLLASIRSQMQIDEISQIGIGNPYAPTFSVEKLNVAGDKTISDLEIQKILAGLLKDDGRRSKAAVAISRISTCSPFLS